MKPKVAILIDGGFFLKRYYNLYPGADGHTAEAIAKNICKASVKHVSQDYELYRIFYYDCSPLGKIVHNPISKKSIDFAKTAVYKLRLELFEELKKKRKVALRLGHIKDSGNWQIYPAKAKALLKGEISPGVILDPLWNPIDPILFEHIDGLNSTSPKPIKKSNK